MTTVVFTGPAVSPTGHSVVRSNLVYACHQTGEIVVQNKVCAATDILVASRKDTVKARTAAAMGVSVMTYPEFISEYLPGVELVQGGVPNRYTDVIDLGKFVPVLVTQAQLTLMDRL